MTEETRTYTLRNVSADLLARVQARGDAEGIGLRGGVIKALETYASPPPPDEVKARARSWLDFRTNRDDPPFAEDIIRELISALEAIDSADVVRSLLERIRALCEAYDVEYGGHPEHPFEGWSVYAFMREALTGESVDNTDWPTGWAGSKRWEDGWGKA